MNPKTHQTANRPALLAAEALSDNPVLVDKISRACDVPASEVADLLTEVMLFLTLIATENQKLSPSLIVDYAWHELILCTRYYHQLCEENFGRYIHHHPGGEESENIKQFNNTLKLYRQHFGKLPSRYWGTMPEEDFADADCGPCSSY